MIINRYQFYKDKILGNDQPLVSIAIPCYNHEKFVQETIQSILEQDYKNIELIIIDDGSSDKSIAAIQEILPACKERFVRFEFRYRANKGLCATLNEALEWCEGLFFSPIASDDILLKNKISKQVVEFNVQIKKDKNLVAIYAGVEYIEESGGSIKEKKGSGNFCDFKGVALRSEFLPTPTFMALRKKVVSIGGFNPDFKVEDLYMRLKLTAAGGVFYVIPDILVKYRRHEDNLSKKPNLIWHEVNKILLEYKDKDIYKKALASSMMVQAHDLQAISHVLGFKFLLKAIKKDCSVIFTKSMLKFFVKILYKPKA